MLELIDQCHQIFLKRQQILWFGLGAFMPSKGFGHARVLTLPPVGLAEYIHCHYDG